MSIEEAKRSLRPYIRKYSIWGLGLGSKGDQQIIRVRHSGILAQAVRREIKGKVSPHKVEFAKSGMPAAMSQG
jgi:hypothetical protein